MPGTALVVGASGITGSAAAELMVAEGWRVAGLARTPVAMEGVTPVATDLRDPAALGRALADLRPSHLVVSTWMRRSTEAEMIEVNGAAMRDLLAAVRPSRSVEHVALVTGLKHYLGPFEAFAKGDGPSTPFREDQGRLDIDCITTRRRTRYSTPPRATASPGASTACTRSSAGRSAGP